MTDNRRYFMFLHGRHRQSRFMPPLNKALVCLFIVLSVPRIRGGNPVHNLWGISLKSSVASDDILLCEYIQKILCARLDQVLNKQRDIAFSKIYNKGLDKIDGEFTVSSFHGRSNVSVKSYNATRTRHILNNESLCIFPNDITSLKITLPPHLESTSKYMTPLQEDTDPTPFQLCTRALVLAFHFFPILSTFPIAYFSNWFRKNIWYIMVARSVAHCGPAFIKWGQWASTRSDMFPDALCTALSHLHSNAPAHSWAVTQDTVEQALSIPRGRLLSVFDSFEPQSIASGSIAQVHRATLRHPDNSGQNNTIPTLVAVKVRHPKVQLLIDMDFRIMSFLAQIVDAVPSLSWIQLRPSIEQFSHTMAAQAHLNVEAHHLEVLNYNFRHWDTVGFPKPLFASSSVIVETFERGDTCTSILDFYDRVAAEFLSPQEGQSPDTWRNNNRIIPVALGHTVIPVQLAKFIVTSGVSLYLKMLLVDNLMHADLHPGNLMLDIIFSPDTENSNTSWKSSEYKSLVPLGTTELHQTVVRSSATMGKLPSRGGDFYGHITLVDAGMVAQLDETESRNFVGLLVAIGEGDGRAAAEVVLGFSSASLTEEFNKDILHQRELFTQDMVAFFATSCRGYGTGLDFGLVLRGILGILKKHHIRIDANYATLVVNLMCVDSLARRVCPSYNCLDAAKPLLRSYKVLYQDSHGHLNLCNRGKWRHTLLRWITPLMQARKHVSDHLFFEELSLRRGTETSNTQMHLLQ